MDLVLIQAEFSPALVDAYVRKLKMKSSNDRNQDDSHAKQTLTFSPSVFIGSLGRGSRSSLADFGAGVRVIAD